MAEKSEKTYIFDNGEHKDLLHKAALNFLINTIADIKKYSGPKHFAKAVSKNITSDTEKLKAFSLIIIGKNPAHAALKPDKFMGSLSNKLTNHIEYLPDEITENLITLSNSLNHRTINEKIFSKMQEEGILDNISGDENYKKYFPSKRGRSSPHSSDETLEENRGRKSIYLVNSEVERLKEIFQNPLARDYFIEELIKTGYVHYIFKFMCETTFYILKSSELTSLQAIHQGTELFEYKLNQKDLDDLPYFLNHFKNLSDKQIENYADIVVDHMIKERDFFSIIPIVGLIKLID